MKAPRVRAVSLGVAALIASALLTVGVPAALWHATGSPFAPPQGGWPHLTEYVSDEAIIYMLAVVCWLAWAVFMACFGVEVAATARRRPTPALPAPALLRRFAAQLVAGVLLLGTMTISTGRATPQPGPVLTSADTIPEPPPPPTTESAPRTYVVQRGDDLWSIADEHLGQPERWPEIWTLNKGRPMLAGEVFQSPDLIKPGWLLQLPAEPTVSAPAEPTVSATQSPPAALAQPSCDATPDVNVSAPQPPDEIDSGAPDERPLIPLPGGGSVTLGLAVGVTLAVTLARLHARRRYRPGETIRPEHPSGHSVSSPTLRALRTASAPPDDETHRRPPLTEVEPTKVSHEPGLLRPPGMALIGEHRDAVARALIATFLAPPDGEAQVVLAESTTGRLLPWEAPHPNMRSAPVNSAISDIEVEVIRRLRTLDSVGVPDFEALATAHAEEAFPRVLLVMDAPSPARLSGIVSVGARVGITILVLGNDPQLTTVDVDQELSTLPQMDASEMAEVMQTLAAARGIGQIMVEPVEPLPDPPETPRAFSVDVAVLGALRICVGDHELNAGVRLKSRELLTYLIAHPDGVTTDRVRDVLWPDVDPAQALNRLNTAVSSLRTALRQATGLEHAEFIQYRGGRYQIDVDAIDSDLWRFQRLLLAVQATDGPDVARHLDEALAQYAGDFADGTYYEWAEPIREGLRRAALDAAARLAQHHERRGDLETALLALEAAIRIDPYVEAIYQELMRIQTALGRPVSPTFRLLEHRLAELGAEPEPATVAIIESANAGRSPQRSFGH